MVGTQTDQLVDALERADRAVTPITLHWILNADVPFLAASVMVVIDPKDTPIRASQVAERMGISVDDATRALHELRSLGYAHEDSRRYEPTEKGMRAHESLATARRDALAAFVSSLSETERRELGDALSGR